MFYLTFLRFFLSRMISPDCSEGPSVSAPQQTILSRVADYYSGKLEKHGPSPRGVDWNGLASQVTRFEQLTKVLPDQECSVLDFGCGYGALYDYLERTHRSEVTFTGLDISEAMITAAKQRHPEASWVTGSDNVEDCAFDYVLASGIFSVRLEFEEERWYQYILSTLDEIDRLSKRGFAFNCLTSYSDEDRKRPDLYYPRPAVFFDLCKTKYARNVALLHDYDLYEFTILVRKS